ncbi:MAG: hypothetical protein JSV30_00015 [Candidatus Omnitrophota bacterium]|nr:MAG: hypothetical protein JSV30_00015 [Candidatus Omnitrophota bacterium]
MDKINVINIISDLHTPAFIYDENIILKKLGILSNLREESRLKILFPLKTFSLTNALYLIASIVNGFSASSLFEAKLARDILTQGKTVHITTPAFRNDEIRDISFLCDYISFNSLSQVKKFYYQVVEQANCGIRINTQLSFIKDDRYNPCRKHSKLGVSLDELRELWKNNKKFFKKIGGILFHTNCESENINQLLETIKHIDKTLPEFFAKINWVNLGGGYLFNSKKDLAPLKEAVNFLKSKYDVEVFFEPGKGVVGEACCIASSVVDIFNSDGKDIAVLDTSVNHMPEVFEYQVRPEIAQESTGGKYKYILAGATCLAGDVFGEYQFARPLAVGSKIIFKTMGAYTLVKAHMFNGVNLPAIYAYTQKEKLELEKQFEYEDFLIKCGGDKYATL